MNRRKIIKNIAGIGLLGSLANNSMRLSASEPDTRIPSAFTQIDGSRVDNWHAELTKRIAELEELGGGTLELGNGVHEINKPLLIPASVSLIMTIDAVIRAKSDFDGDAVIIKYGGGELSKLSHTSGWIRGGIIDGNGLPLTGIRVEKTKRLEIADLVVLNAMYKGIHLCKGGYETNISRYAR